MRFPGSPSVLDDQAQQRYRFFLVVDQLAGQDIQLGRLARRATVNVQHVDKQHQVDGPDGAQLPAGRYQARLAAVDEEAAVAGDPVDVEIRPLLLGTDQATLLAARDAPPPPPVRVEAWWVLLAALGGLGVGAIAALTTRRRGADA